MTESTPAWKKVLGVLALLALFATMVLVAFGFWAKHKAEEMLVDVQTDLPAVAEEGARFAAAHTAVECVQEGQARAVQCGAIDIPCQLSASLFGSSCLEAATPDPAVCEAVPSKAAPEERATWAKERCAAEGFADSSTCPSYHQQVLVSYCSAQPTAE